MRLDTLGGLGEPHHQKSASPCSDLRVYHIFQFVEDSAVSDQASLPREQGHLDVGDLVQLISNREHELHCLVFEDEPWRVNCELGDLCRREQTVTVVAQIQHLEGGQAQEHKTP